MSRRKRARQKGRRTLDYRAMMVLQGNLLRIRAHCSHEAAAAGAEATPKEGADGLVTLYDVQCLFELPVSPTETAAGITTRFDISDGDYPSAEPRAVVTSPKKPLCAHVAPESGVLCSGQLWKECHGNELLAEFVLRVIRAYNFESSANHEAGYQPAAAWFARERLGGRPFHPELVLPVIPESVFQAAGATPRATRPRLVVLGPAARITPERARSDPAARPRLVVLPSRSA